MATKKTHSRLWRAARVKRAPCYPPPFFHVVSRPRPAEVGEISPMDPCMASRAACALRSPPAAHACSSGQPCGRDQSGHPTRPRHLYPRNTSGRRWSFPGIPPGYRGARKPETYFPRHRRACISLHAHPRQNPGGVAHALAPPCSRTLPALARADACSPSNPRWGARIILRETRGE